MYRIVIAKLDVLRYLGLSFFIASGVVGPAWSMDLLQVYEAATINDATIRTSRAGAEASRERLPQARALRRTNSTRRSPCTGRTIWLTARHIPGTRRPFWMICSFFEVR